jgi:hypothetical protein
MSAFDVGVAEAMDKIASAEGFRSKIKTLPKGELVAMTQRVRRRFHPTFPKQDPRYSASLGALKNELNMRRMMGLM